MAALDVTLGAKQPSPKAAKRRQQIVEATMRSIVKQGLSGTTLASVAKEAGLSQGSAVFYFNTKLELLAEVLRHLYEDYETAWRGAVEQAGPEPLEQLLAMLRVDFEPPVCTPDALFIWHAFWGEAGSRPSYAAITEIFEAPRFAVLRGHCATLLQAAGRSEEEAENLAIALDALSDGLWWRLYLSEGNMTPAQALSVVADFLATSLPQHAVAIAQGLGNASEREV